MAEHIQTGKEGEEASVNYLRKLGYQILETNWRFRKLELDIIALDGDMLVAIEVKTRSTNEFGEPEVFVTKSKQKKIIKAINHYVQQTGAENEIRLDIIAVVSRNGQTDIHHIPEAFYPAVTGG
jgi:putative endonuclease